MHIPATPLPLRGTGWGELGALSVIVSAPLALPVAAGVKVTLTVQLKPDARFGGQSSVSSKFAVVVMLVIFRADVP
jgi:hypothetical protein